MSTRSRRTSPAQGRAHAADAVDSHRGRQVAEVLLDQAHRLSFVDVAGDREAGVGRRVELSEEVLDVVERGGVQVLLRAYDRPAIRMRRREQRGLQEEMCEAVGPVLVALAALVFYDVALRIEALLVQGVEKEPHPVRFEPQRELQVVGRNVLPVIRPVRCSGPVELRARLHQRLEVVLIVVLGPLEHHVLEQVGESGAARLLVLRAYVVPHVDGYNGQRMVFVQDHLEAVGQDRLFVGDRDHQALHRFRIGRIISGCLANNAMLSS